jgi:hypothetical protein
VEALLRWVGIALVVLAAAFLVSTAINRGWISPELQLLGAAMIGAGLLGASLWLSPRRPATPAADRHRGETVAAVLRRRWAVAFGIGGASVFIVSAAAAYGWLGLWTAGTGLALVAIAAAISLLVAMATRLEPVAIASTAAMFIAPTWALIIADAPPLSTGLWLGGFAIVALVVGVDRRWPLYRLISTVAAALWTVGLAGFLFNENNVDYAVPGLALVALLTAVLWIGPVLAGGRSARTGAGATAGSGHQPKGNRGPGSWLVALDNRAVLAVPLWALATAGLFAGIESERTAGLVALGLGAGFLVAAVVARSALSRLSGRRWQLPDVLFGSHLLGAGILLPVAAARLLESSAVPVALAAQAVATLLVGYRLNDRWLKLNGALLAAPALVMAAVPLLSHIADGTSSPIVIEFGSLLTFAMLVVFAAVVDRHEPTPVSEVVNGLVWSLGLAIAGSVMAQTSVEEGWLVFGTAVAVLSIAASGRLGFWVRGLGLVAGALTLAGSARSIALAFPSVAGSGAEPGFTGSLVADLAANLVVVATLACAAFLARRAASPGASGGPIYEVLFGFAWVYGLGWLAAALYQLGSPVNQVAISVTWAVAAGGAIVASIVIGDRVFSLFGLTTLGAVLLKLMVVDLAEVDTLWRVGLFLVIGLGLLRLGYVLPRLAAGRSAGESATNAPAGLP